MDKRCFAILDLENRGVRLIDISLETNEFIYSLVLSALKHFSQWINLNFHWLFLGSYVKNQVQFPALANLALEYLSIPGTAVPSERVWSDGGNIISSGRQSISTANFRMLIFLKENLLK